MAGIADKIMKRVSKNKKGWVCTPKDFVDMGSRTAVDQALSRLVKAGRLRRVGRGLYDVPRTSNLLKRVAPVDLYSGISAVVRRDDARILPDSLDSANLLGLTNAVAAKAIYETDGSSRTVIIDGFTVRFRHAPPSVMRWAGKPGVRVVQALRWLGPYASADPDVVPILRRTLPDYVKLDLSKNIRYLPAWMRSIVNKVTSDQRVES